MKELIFNKEQTNRQIELDTATGEKRDFLVVPVLLQDSGGGAEFVICTFSDVTEQNRAHDKLQRTAIEFSQLIETANAPIFGIDINGRIDTWNHKLFNITGYTLAEVTGMRLIELIEDMNQGRVQEVLDKALQGEESSNYEVDLLSKDGGTVILLVNATTRRDYDGKIVGVIGVGQDITMMRRTDAVKNQGSKLEALGQLTGGVAHDFNNLLTIVLGNLRLLLEEESISVDDELTDILGDAIAAAEDGAKINKQLLTFARKNEQVVLSPTHVYELLAKSQSLIKRIFDADTEFSLEVAENVGLIMADPSLLMSSIINLAANARDSIKDNGKVTLKAERKHFSIQEALLVEGINTGEHIVISMKDNGSGISPENLTKVLDPFFSTKSTGAGLGLSMVYGTIRQFNGAVSINTKLGRGTTVRLIFPELIEDQPDYATVEMQQQTMVVHKKTVLVVEDEPRVRRYSSRVFQTIGFDVIEAEDAARAVQVLSENKKVDLVFSDIVMPGHMNGRQLADFIFENFPDIPVVLTSGFEKLISAATPDQSAEVPLLKKPFTKAELLEVLPTFND